jgi:hypothetical protein
MLGSSMLSLVVALTSLTGLIPVHSTLSQYKAGMAAGEKEMGPDRTCRTCRAGHSEDFCRG